jgi:predicted nucleic acid-binding protein
VITLDTSGLLAFIATQARQHDEIEAIMRADRGPFLVAVAALAEITFMIERDFPPHVEEAFLFDLSEDRYALYWDGRDLARIQDLTRRYQDLPLGFADAAVVVCAERHGGVVLTLDRRHFDVVARGEHTLTVLP